MVTDAGTGNFDPSSAVDDRYRILYRFCLHDGRERRFELSLDADTLIHHPPDSTQSRHWTALGFNQCAHCSLNTDTHADCPLALSVATMVEHCYDLSSHERLHLIVETPQRTVRCDTSVQHGFSSLLGLLAATSGCPYTRYFRPMACFHLPVATEHETVYRAASMYLLAQYFAHKDGRTTDLDLQGLIQIYRDIQVVNNALARRLRAATDQDGAVNAVVLLDLLAKALPYNIDGCLAEIRPLFAGYDYGQPEARG